MCAKELHYCRKSSHYFSIIISQPSALVIQNMLLPLSPCYYYKETTFTLICYVILFDSHFAVDCVVGMRNGIFFNISDFLQTFF